METTTLGLNRNVVVLRASSKLRSFTSLPADTGKAKAHQCKCGEFWDYPLTLGMTQSTLVKSRCLRIKSQLDWKSCRYPDHDM